MQTIKLDTRVGQDGILKLELSLEVTDADLEVLVVVQRKEKRGWPPGYFERTAGSLADDPIERPPQGVYEERDTLL
ncbi:MAG: hypothetical protein JNM70_03180 [Anaerolineae bacterium]|nr:hypothetical protein [Anaerolineae bacterium]